MSVNGLDLIIGREVESVRVGDDEVLLFAFTDGTSAAFVAVGDCCSHSWFEHVDSVGFKGTILRVDGAMHADITQEDVDKIVASNEHGDQVVLLDFTTFYTEHGRLHVEMRNSSNGYYSGWIEAADDSTVNAVKVWKLAE